MNKRTKQEISESLKLTSLWDREMYLKKFKSDLLDILELKKKGVTQVWEYNDFCEDIDINIAKREAVIASCETTIAEIREVMGIIHTMPIMIEVSTECKHCEGTGEAYDSRVYTRAGNCVECNGLGVIITIEQKED
jgi:DnaJ-class molecular chaperone